LVDCGRVILPNRHGYCHTSRSDLTLRTPRSSKAENRR
jgi:hypothetical protein